MLPMINAIKKIPADVLVKSVVFEAFRVSIMDKNIPYAPIIIAGVNIAK